MTYFDTDRRSKLFADGCPTGIYGIVVQRDNAKANYKTIETMLRIEMW